MADARFETAVFNAVREPLLVLDRELHAVMANASFYRTFAMKPPDTLGIRLAQIGGGAWSSSELTTKTTRLLGDGRPFQNVEIEHEFDGVGYLSLQVNGDLIPLSTDRDVLVVLAMEDVTLRRAAERAAALASAELARSNAALEQFASVASHDLQEPLRKIIAFSGLLMEDCGSQLDEQATDYLNRITNAGRRMQGLINDVLQFSRLKQMKPAARSVDLSTTVSEALIDLEDRMRATGASVDVGALPSIVGDATQLRLVFQNLVGNALKFGRAGVPPRIRIGATAASGPADETVEIVIEDNGIGFDQKYAEKIFSPFQRLHTRKAYEGTGMGLAIAKEVVTAHGGRIGVTSTPGEGSRFLLTLPISGAFAP